MDLRKLIHQCQKDDRKAQRRLLDTYSGLLYNVALRYAVDRAEAKDILQDAWVKIFKGLTKYNEEGKIEGWMSRIVINTALRNKGGFEKRSAVYVDTFHEPPTIKAAAIEQLQYDDLLRLVNQLKDPDRKVFKLVCIDGWKHKEVGELLNIEESTSRAHLARARAKLREVIKQVNAIEIGPKV